MTASPTEAAPPAARVPAVVESITKEDFEKKNVVGPEDIFKYLPGLYVRKLSPGRPSAPLSIKGGIAEVRILKPGIWMIFVSHKLPYPNIELADEYSYQATLTFEVKP